MQYMAVFTVDAGVTIWSYLLIPVNRRLTPGVLGNLVFGLVFFALAL